MDIRKNIALPAMMIGVFILEGVISLVFSKQLFSEERLFIPHFLLIMLILLTTFYKRSTAFIYAFSLGILFDIYYTGIMGIYFALFPLVVYLTDKLMKVLQDNIVFVGLVTLFHIILVESLVYAFYYLIGAIPVMDIAEFVNHRLWTTLLLNLAFYLIIFFPFYLFLDKLVYFERS